MGTSKKPHATMIPLPHQGHINPFISLALRLASKGISVTFVHYEFVHHILTNSQNSEQVELFSKERKLGLDIRCATVGDGLPLEFDRDVHLLEFHAAMLREIPGRVDELVARIIGSDPDSAHFLVTDTFYSWPSTVAKKHNIVNVSFWTEPALVFSLVYHAELLREKGHFPLKDGVEEEVKYIPGIESVNTKDFMPYLKQSDLSTLSHTIVFAAFNDVKNAHFILHNAIHELEPQTLAALNKHQPNYAIGPVNNFPQTSPNSSLWSKSNCAHWLGSKPPGSVLYVSFGSLVHTSKRVVEEVARGLVISGANFVWVVRAGVAGADGVVLPDGFEDEIDGRGLIVPWCDQVRVLSDPAIGGFLTHCGWNSVLESVWFGVPMICYPINYDQPINRKLVVDDWKIGVNLCDGGGCVDRNEVAEKIRRLMVGCFEESLGRVRAKLKNAVEIDGSSERNLDQFLKDLKAKIL